MSCTQPLSQACHNCRRRRLKCDRSVPHCSRCIQKGEECLGYQRLFRWEKGVASRGKMAGRTFQELAKSHLKEEEVSVQCPLIDPLLQDLSPTSRQYLRYCELSLASPHCNAQGLAKSSITVATNVCKDLVLYDTSKHNCFRELIPMTHQSSSLLHIVIANSALHMFNASRALSAVQSMAAHRDAIEAKQRALCSLQIALMDINSANTDFLLAVILLFVEFELIDSAPTNWRHHINGARAIIRKLYGPGAVVQSPISPLRSFLVSNCLIFDIFGSTLSSSTGLIPCENLSEGDLSLLRDAEGNHCSSMPTVLLQLIQTGAQLLNTPTPFARFKQQQSLHLLAAAQSFDPLAWATNLQARSPSADLEARAHVAFAHRAATCIYVSRICMSFHPDSQLPTDLEALEVDIISHLTCIHPSDALFKATAWPAFIVGAETKDSSRQEWVARRFADLWDVEPWGLIRGTLGVLNSLWGSQRSKTVSSEQEDGDWVVELTARGVDWLIL